MFVSTRNLRGDRSYPYSDGAPFSESDFHRIAMMSLIETLQSHFANDPLVYVSGNLFVHYEPGNRRRHLAPDVFFVRGVPNVQRLNYLVWEEGKGPDVIIEVTSRTTRDEDVFALGDCAACAWPEANGGKGGWVPASTVKRYRSNA